MKLIQLITILVIFLLITGCAVHGPMQPLGKGNKQVTAGVGGPFVYLDGYYFPMTLPQVSGCYGLSQRTNFSGTLHLTPLLVSIAAPEVQITHYPKILHSENSFIGISGRLSMFATLKSNVKQHIFILPTTGLFYTRKFKNSRSFHAGADLTIVPERSTYDDDAETFMFTPYVGYSIPLGKTMILNTELRWMAANIETRYDAVSYQGIGGYGGITPMISLGWRF